MRVKTTWKKARLAPNHEKVTDSHKGGKLWVYSMLPLDLPDLPSFPLVSGRVFDVCRVNLFRLLS